MPARTDNIIYCDCAAPAPLHPMVRAIGLSQKEASQSVRFSFGDTTTEDEVLTVARNLANGN
ncbi:MAG: hypothetical protein ACETWG_06780 [Candidatus Neomarinimicrobiota bacterium]